MKHLLIFPFLLLLNHSGIGQTAPLDIVYIGDSITAGATLPNHGTESPGVICTQVLQAKLTPRVVNSFVYGRSGHTTVDFLPPNAKDFVEAEGGARKLQADHPGDLLFSVMLGTNDSAVKGPNGSPVQPQIYKKNLTAIVDQLIADFPACKIVIHHPIWYSPNTHNFSLYGPEGLARLENYSPMIDDLVRKESEIHPGHVFRGDTAAFAYFQANHEKELTPEKGVEGFFYLHPNVIGASTLGTLWAQALLPMEGANGSH